MHRVACRGVVILTLLVLGVGASPVQAGPAMAPNFTLELFSGASLSLASLRGSAVILLFWAPW